MGNLRNRLLGLCLPPVLFAGLDATLTLAGQSPAYWRGAYTQVNEGSPAFHHLLTIHPWAFAAGILAWICAFVGIILLLPDTLALIVSIALTLGHTVGAATWILFQFRFGYQACNALFLLSAVVLGLGIRWGWRAGPPREERAAILSAPWRWALAAALFALGAYVSMWPSLP